MFSLLAFSRFGVEISVACLLLAQNAKSVFTDRCLLHASITFLSEPAHLSPVVLPQKHRGSGLRRGSFNTDKNTKGCFQADELGWSRPFCESALKKLVFIYWIRI